MFATAAAPSGLWASFAPIARTGLARQLRAEHARAYLLPCSSLQRQEFRELNRILCTPGCPCSVNLLLLVDNCSTYGRRCDATVAAEVNFVFRCCREVCFHHRIHYFLGPHNSELSTYDFNLGAKLLVR